MSEKLKALWEKYKIYIIGAGALLALIKGKDLIIDLLVNNSKRTMDKAQKVDDQLAAKEDAAKATAQAFVDHAKKLEEDKKPVDADWNKQ